MSQLIRKNEKIPVHTRECACGALVTVTGFTGPSDICEECAGRLRDFVLGVPGAQFPPEYLFPLQDASPVSCGLRTDLPKKERVHRNVYLGTDPRHTETGFEELHVYACARCGRDRQTRTPPPGTAA